MNYTSKQLVENYLKRDLAENEEAFLMVINPAIKRWIDKHLDSRFDKVDPSTKLFRGGVGSIDIDPCTDITNVELLNADNTLSYAYTVNTEWSAEPVNERVKRELIRPYGYCFGTVNSWVRVTARFSEWDGGVPGDITMVATRIAGDLLKSQAQSTDGSTVSKESIEGHSIEYDTSQVTIEDAALQDPLVQAILSQRREVLVG